MKPILLYVLLGGLVLIFVAVLLLRKSDQPTPPTPPIPTKKVWLCNSAYKCTDNGLDNPNGYTTQEACQKACAAPVGFWNCSGAPQYTCTVTQTKSPYPTSDPDGQTKCLTACRQPAPMRPWMCQNNQCINTGEDNPNGWATKDECDQVCSAPPATYWACDNTTYTCSETSTKTPFTSKELCLAACKAPPPLLYYNCTTTSGTPVRDGNCLVTAHPGADSWQCANRSTDCTKCDEQVQCTIPQYWSCNTVANTCVPTDVSLCQQGGCWVTTPGQSATYANYDTCVTKCAVKPPDPPTPAPDKCADSTKAYRFDSTKGTCVCEQNNTGGPTVAYGACASTTKTCTLKPPPDPTGTPLYYESLGDCLCCACGAIGGAQYQYCAGASTCGPVGSECCGPTGDYCNPGECQKCDAVTGRCVDACAALKDCSTCTVTGECKNIYCTPLFAKQCTDGVCVNMAGDCAAPLVWRTGSDSKWWCPGGGWCIDPNDPTLSYTFADNTNVPGKCADGSACVKLNPGKDFPPGASMGCWPSRSNTPLSQLPPI